MGSIKDRNVINLTEAEDIKKRWQEYTEELYKKDLHNPDNHEGVITHPEPDIPECLGLTTNKSSFLFFSFFFFCHQIYLKTSTHEYNFRIVISISMKICFVIGASLRNLLVVQVEISWKNLDFQVSTSKNHFSRKVCHERWDETLLMDSVR